MLPLDKEEFFALKQGDLRILEKVVRSFEREIYFHAFRFTRNKEDAEDITQETFIKLYRFRSSLDENKNLKSLVYKIATNTAYDFLRKRKHEPRVQSIDESYCGENETIPDHSSYNSIEERTKHLDVEKAMVDMKPLYRQVLSLFYQRDQSYKEIAEHLSLPLNTVKTHIRRAKKIFREKLGENYHEK